MNTSPEREASWAHHSTQWRDPAQVASYWREASDTDPKLLEYTVDGRWWDVLAELDITLFVTREYEHLVLALGVAHGRPSVTFLPLPHPSGLAVDRTAGRLHVASTRNPNQIYELAPRIGHLERVDIPARGAPVGDEERPLLPIRSRYLPGCLYLHDLSLVDGRLHANAVGENSIIALCDDGGYERVWWPASIDGPDGPHFERNYLQLNSIAAGTNLAESYFSASAGRRSRRVPGHRNFAVDKRGVIFSGRTRAPIAHGLTRPHSARLHEGRIWVDNSGYGEVGVIRDGRFESVQRLPGWTRGLCFAQGIAFVGTSRVIPAYRHYAPGLAVDSSVCALHVLDSATARVLGSLTWPGGNQIFGLDWAPRKVMSGLPFQAHGARAPVREKNLFYNFKT